MANGICKLTGTHGKFVDAHLIPSALTQPAEKGAPLVQFGEGSRPARRWSSWYDSRLVTQPGEDILSELDGWGISALRQRKLVWSGWGPMQILSVEDHDLFPGTPWGVRAIKGLDLKRLRLFFLSLLWRAAVTDRHEFSEVEMPSDDVERLRLMLVSGNPDPLSFYPCSLIQISTLGVTHNLPPLAQIKIIPKFEGAEEKSIPIFRFYFDGLIAHIYRQASDDGYAESLGPLVVGVEDDLSLLTVTYEHSFERENLDQVMAEAVRDWPQLMKKLL